MIGSMITERIAVLKDRVRAACGRAHRKPEDIQLVLVSKYVAVEKILEAYRSGIHHFGESRVQEWLRKKSDLPSEIRWHFIGHLQTNKVKDCVGQASLIHSVDSVKLARVLNEHAQKAGRSVDCLLQVNTAGEGSKFGIHPDRLSQLVEAVVAFPQLRVCGLMTIGPLTDDEKEIHASFQLLRRKRDVLQKEFNHLKWSVLSMGMSHDFEMAIEEGSNLIRIGSAVFGERKHA